MKKLNLILPALLSFCCVAHAHAFSWTDQPETTPGYFLRTYHVTLAECENAYKSDGRGANCLFSAALPPNAQVVTPTWDMTYCSTGPADRIHAVADELGAYFWLEVGVPSSNCENFSFVKPCYEEAFTEYSQKLTIEYRIENTN